MLVYSIINEILIHIHIELKTRLRSESVEGKMADEGKTTRDLSLVPPLTFGFVEDVVRQCVRSDGNTLSKGYKYFSEKYVNNIRGN